ncbi:MAG TPA: sulfatase-like hydrolase/transferase [Terriglobia bacterium]|nr:sulfatase-like hydrolase/transferase [Terriglobia bacterium]
MNRFPKYRTVLATFLLGLCASTGLSQSNSGRPPRPTPVLLITVDTLRADRLSSYGARRVRTPAMDALAVQGVRFDRALAQVPTTPPSHAVILTGTYPMYNGVRDFISGALSKNVGVLAEAFRRHGYDTAAFVSSTVLESSWGFNRGFQTYDDHFGLRQVEARNPGGIERRAEETVDLLLAWFQARRKGGSTAPPFFVWLHLYDPHVPYDPPEPFRSQYAGHLYDGEIAYADSQLARLFEYLRKNALYDRTLIVLMSDHGESLGEHGEDEHGFFIYDSTLHVPLIFKLPRGMGAPRVVQRLVATIDVAPTLFELVHLRDPLSRQFQGMSLASDILGKGAGRERPVYAETYYPRDSFGWSELHAIISDRFKYIQAPRPELYDLLKDPEELHNVHAERRSLAAALREQLIGIERRYASTQPAATAPPLPPETVEKLKSLGYVAYSASVRPASAGPLIDPKDRLKVFKGVLRAQALNEAGRSEESNRVLEPLAREEPELFVIPYLQGENLSQLRRWSEAKRSYLACLKLNPTFERALMGLARAYLSEGEVEQARPVLELVVHEYPRNYQAVYALGQVARREGNHEEAYRFFRKAAEAMPSVGYFQQDLGITLVDLKRYQEALGPLSRAEELLLPDARLEHYLGTALANVGRFKEAVDHYQKALKMKPNLVEARLSLAFAYLNLGDRQSARREFQSVCAQSDALCQQYRLKFEESPARPSKPRG